MASKHPVAVLLPQFQKLLYVVVTHSKCVCESQFKDTVIGVFLTAQQSVETLCSENQTQSAVMLVFLFHCTGGGKNTKIFDCTQKCFSITEECV